MCDSDEVQLLIIIIYCTDDHNCIQWRITQPISQNLATKYVEALSAKILAVSHCWSHI